MPNDAGTWLNLGHSLLEAGELEAGYECFRTAARGDQKQYYSALTTLVKSGRGRFWLWPREAVALSARREELTLRRAELPAIDAGLTAHRRLRFNQARDTLAREYFEIGRCKFRASPAGIAPPACPSAARR